MMNQKEDTNVVDVEYGHHEGHARIQSSHKYRPATNNKRFIDFPCYFFHLFENKIPSRIVSFKGPGKNTNAGGNKKSKSNHGVGN